MNTIGTISHVNGLRGGRVAGYAAVFATSIAQWFGRRRSGMGRAGQARKPGFWARFFEVRRTRIALAELDERMLQDIGVTRDQALEEAERWRWDRTW